MNSKEEAREKRVQMPVPLLAYLGRPPWSWPVRRRQAPRPVPSCPSQSTTPPIRRRPKFISPFPPHPLVFFLCNMSLPIHQPWGASPLTRRASSEAAELTKQASQVLPPVLSDCSTDLASQNLQQPVVERNDDIVPPLRHLTYHGPGGDGGGRPPLSPLLPPRDDDNAGT